MANVQIYQLDNAGSDLDNSALLAMDIPNPDTSAASEVPYVTRKESIASLETQMLQTDEYTTELDTTRKTITGAINEQQSVIGYSYDSYDATTAYAKDDLCIYNNTLYKAKQATTGNLPTNTTYWEETSIADEISELKTSLTYNAGDGIGISNSQLAGILTTGQKQIIIQIPVLKPISASTATLNPDSLWSIRHVSGGYIISNAKLSTIGTYSLVKNGIGLVLTIDLTNAFTGAPNNTPIVGSLAIDNNNIITFS